MFGGGGMRPVTALGAAAVSVALVVGSAGPAASAADVDRHAGYYYPEPVTSETYIARAVTLKDAKREVRLGFVTALTEKELARPYPPPYAVFAKGSEAEKMIIVATGDAGFHTLYQARALLAQLTATVRTTRWFREMAVEDLFTFLDLAKLLGFTQVTISDGETFSHQILIR